MSFDKADEIIAEVSHETGVPVERILSRQRTRSVAQARHMAMCRVRAETGLSLMEIGEVFDREHTTIMHALKKKLATTAQ